ncbi:uncharacterized protein LOC111868144 [Cryptotermes secundus]|uniref:uncharacterized protein LOC111868144 n=1 Tax=Cryptotermes secundus TaxID=105785 RepID=UPI000CD7D03C|nr:uncharacterized protein LOC111868144 [Cryptotermes secundus]
MFVCLILGTKAAERWNDRGQDKRRTRKSVRKDREVTIKLLKDGKEDRAKILMTRVKCKERDLQESYGQLRNLQERFLLSNAESWDTPVNQRSTRDTRKEPGTNAAIVASNCVG